MTMSSKWFLCLHDARETLERLCMGFQHFSNDKVIFDVIFSSSFSPFVVL